MVCGVDSDTVRVRSGCEGGSNTSSLEGEAITLRPLVVAVREEEEDEDDGGDEHDDDVDDDDSMSSTIFPSCSISLPLFSSIYPTHIFVSSSMRLAST